MPVQTSSDDDSSSDEDVQPPAQRGARAAPRRPVWRTRTAADVSSAEPAFLGPVYVSRGVRRPVEYFSSQFDDDMKANIVDQSNLYATQVNANKPLGLDISALEKFVGILFLMSVVRMSRARMYWSLKMRFPKIADVMPLSRWETIKRMLHISDNNSCPDDCTDRLYKIRPLIDAITTKVRSILPGEKMSIDEQVVPFKGKSRLRQYNPKKPKKWGYKVFVLSGINGLIHNFEVYTGKIDTCPGQPDLKPSANIVLRLLASIPRMLWHKVFFDNWFTGTALQVTLWKQGIACVGTVRGNRLPGCKMPEDKVLRKKGRGAMVLQTTVMEGVELRAVKWFDNRGVTLLSPYAAIEPLTNVQRFDRKINRRVQVECPSIVTTYNQFMGGVDLLDSLLALYRIPVRSKKWYHRLIFHFLDVLLVQSWLLYRRDADASGVPRKSQLPLLQFKIEVADSLVLEGKAKTAAKRGRPSLNVAAEHALKQKRGPTAPIPSTSVRADDTGHWPAFSEKRGRCRNPGCSGVPKVTCTKCNVHLCFTPATNCFREFHQ